MKFKKLFNLLKLWFAMSLLEFSNLDIREARTKKELEEAYKIRYSIYLEEGYIESNSSGMFEDEYDSYSVNFLIYKQKRPIGAFRLTLDSPVGFSFENFANFERPNVPSTRIGEVNRLCVYKSQRGGKLIMLGVVKTVHEYTRKCGIEYLYIGTQEKLAHHIESYGVVLEELKEYPPTEYNLKNRELLKGYFAQNVPKHYLIDIKKSIEVMTLHW